VAAEQCQITVNGQSRTVRAETLEAALAELGFGDAKVATALNGAFVAASQRSAVKLTNGDRLEVVAPRAGG